MHSVFLSDTWLDFYYCIHIIGKLIRYSKLMQTFPVTGFISMSWLLLILVKIFCFYIYIMLLLCFMWFWIVSHIIFPSLLHTFYFANESQIIKQVWTKLKQIGNLKLKHLFWTLLCVYFLSVTKQLLQVQVQNTWPYVSNWNKSCFSLISLD